MGSVLLVAFALGIGPSEPEVPVELDWEAPPGCPDRDDVLAQVERFVPPEHRVGAATLHAMGRLRAEGRAWSLELVVRGEGSRMERTLRGDHCGVLASAAALVVAVMVEPAAVLEEVEAIANVEPPAREPEVLPPDPIDPPPESAARPGGFVAARGLVSWGAVPGVGGVVALGGGLRFGRWRVGLEALFDTPRRAILADEDAAAAGAGARIAMAGAGLRGCYSPGAKRVEVPLCGGFEAGALWATGVGLAQPKTAVSAWGAFVLGSGLAIVVHPRLALRLDVEGVVPLRRPRFVVEDRGVVYRPAPIGARAGAAIELRLP